MRNTIILFIYFVILLSGCQKGWLNSNNPYWMESFRIEDNTVLQFGDDETRLPLTIKDASKTAYKAQCDKDWVTFDNDGTGEFEKGENTLYVYVNRQKMDEGKNNARVTITANSSPTKRTIPLEVNRKAIIQIDNKLISLGNEKTKGSFIITSYNGSFRLTISGTPSWMKLSSDDFTLYDNGNKTISKEITFTIDRSTVPEGFSKAELTISSSSGTFEDTVEITVNQPLTNTINATAGYYNMTLTKCFVQDNGISLAFSIHNSGKGSQIIFNGTGYAKDEKGNIFNIYTSKTMTLLEGQKKDVEFNINKLTQSSMIIKELFIPASDKYDTSVKGFLFSEEILLPWDTNDK